MMPKSKNWRKIMPLVKIQIKRCVFVYACACTRMCVAHARAHMLVQVSPFQTFVYESTVESLIFVINCS